MDEWKRRGYEPFDLKNPETYTQKIQWAEIYENDPRKTTYSDKVAVREWISETIGDEYLIKSLGVFSNVDDIDFDKLPDRFAIKLNNSSGFNIIVKDKSKNPQLISVELAFFILNVLMKYIKDETFLNLILIVFFGKYQLQNY